MHMEKRMPRIPPNLFGAAFGLAGLGEAWQTAARTAGSPVAVAAAIDVLAAAVWVILAAGYLRGGSRQVMADLRDPVAAPFVPLALIAGMLLGAELCPYAAGPGQVIVAFCLTGTVLLGGWLTGQWIAADLDLAAFHPGYLLPTVAGGFVGAAASVQAGFPAAVARAAFGIGLTSWLLVGPALLGRLFFRPMLAGALVPTLAIVLAPPAVGGIAYLALGGPGIGTEVLGGCTVLMALAQVRLIPLYLHLRFGPGFWAFTFSYAATASYALDWLARERPPGHETYAVAVLVAITGFIAAIAVRSLITLARGQFLPAGPGLRSPQREDLTVASSP